MTGPGNQEQSQEAARFCWRTMLILVAMEKRRAPLPISWRFLKACSSSGWPENPDDIAGVVERYLLRSDESLVLNKLRTGIGREMAKGT